MMTTMNSATVKCLKWTCYVFESFYTSVYFHVHCQAIYCQIVLNVLGEIISDDEDDDGEEGDDDEDTFMQKQREKLEAEKEAILNNKNLIAEVQLTYVLYPLMSTCVF